MGAGAANMLRNLAGAVTDARGKAVVIGVMNQAVSGGVGFLLAIFLVTQVGHREFGAYSIGFAAMLLFAGFGQALVGTQMVARLPHIADEEKISFARAMLYRSLVLGAAVIGVAVACVLTMAGLDLLRGYEWLTIAASFASASVVVKDFFARWAYSRRRELDAFASNCTMAIVTFGTNLVLWLTDCLQASTAMFAVGIGYLASAFTGFILSDIELFKKGGAIDWATRLSGSTSLRHDSAWALAGTLVVWLQGQAYVYLTALVLGPAAVGQVSTARLFVSPFFFLLPALNQLALPRFASIGAQDSRDLLLWARRYVRVITTMGACYALAIAAAYPWLSEQLGKGSELHLLVVAWGAVVVAQLTREGASTPLQAMREFRGVLLCNVWTTAATVAIGSLLVLKAAGLGAVLSVAIGEALLAVGLWRVLRRSTNRPTLQA